MQILGNTAYGVPAFTVFVGPIMEIETYHSVLAIREPAMGIKTSIPMAELQVNSLVDLVFMISTLRPTWLPPKNRDFFTLPDELVYLNLGYKLITAYAYLLCRENRRTHQCHPSHNTIADTAGPSTAALSRLSSKRRMSFIN